MAIGDEQIDRLTKELDQVLTTFVENLRLLLESVSFSVLAPKNKDAEK